jgi:hypothetical protein
VPVQERRVARVDDQDSHEAPARRRGRTL